VSVCVCVCSLMYRECNGHAPFFHPLSAQLYNIFQIFLTSGMVFGRKKMFKGNCVSIFLQFLSETFLILRRIERHFIKMYICLHVKYTLFLTDINETLIFSKGLEKYSNIKFHKMGAELFHASGRTNGWRGRQTWKGWYRF